MKMKSKFLSSLLVTILFALNLPSLGSFAVDFQEMTDTVKDTTQGNILKQTIDGAYYMAHNPHGHISLTESKDGEKFLVVENGENGTTVLKLPASTNPRCINALIAVANRYLPLLKDGNIKFYDKTKQTIEIESEFKFAADKNLNDKENIQALVDQGYGDLEGFFFVDLTGLEELSPRETWEAELEFEVILDKLKEGLKDMDKETLIEIEVEIQAFLEMIKKAGDDISEEEMIKIEIRFKSLLELLKSKGVGISDEEINKLMKQFD
jgi:hypothetical protein